MFKIRQIFSDAHIRREDIRQNIFAKLSDDIFSVKVQPGMRIAITAGSRGVANVDVITKTLAEFVKEKGGLPFIVPAMGSHGGANAEGQREILTGYNVTEEFCGCPVISSMEVKKIGVNEEGTDVYIDKAAAEADGIIVCGRVKPHTCFRGPFESGIMKMMAIGLGKQVGASVCHAEGFKYMAKYVPMFGRAIIQNAPILFALATIENAYDQTFKLEAILPEKIEDREPVLLEESRVLMPKISVEECDLLIVDEIGKNYSGDGMDPNITGTFCVPYASGGIRSQRVAVLDLSDETHGNAIGIGMAHATTDRVFHKARQEMYVPNCITSKVLDGGRMPIHLASDREAMQICLATCTEYDEKNPRVVRIPNSLHMQVIELSEAYYAQAKKDPSVQILTEPEELPFDEDGNLLDLRKWAHSI
jgi:hypothetical protein